MSEENRRIAELYADSDAALVPLEPGCWIVEVTSNRKWQTIRVQDANDHPQSAVNLPCITEYLASRQATARKFLHRLEDE